MLNFGEAKSWGQYHSTGLSTVDSFLIASPVMTALLERGDDRNPWRYTTNVDVMVMGLNFLADFEIGKLLKGPYHGRVIPGFSIVS